MDGERTPSLPTVPRLAREHAVEAAQQAGTVGVVLHFSEPIEADA